MFKLTGPVRQVDPPAIDAFSVRLYEWSRDQFRQEIRDSFPLLRRIRNTTVVATLGDFFGRTLNECDELAVALMKRFHPRAVELLNIRATPHELELVRSLDEMRSGPNRPNAARELEAAHLRAKPNARAVLRVARKHLDPLFGRAPESEFGTCRYRTSIGPWTFSTELIVNSGVRGIDYFHFVEGDRLSQLYAGINICSCFGISSSCANYVTSPDEAEIAAQVTRDCVARMLDAAPQLLDGIAPYAAAG